MILSRVGARDVSFQSEAVPSKMIKGSSNRIRLVEWPVWFLMCIPLCSGTVINIRLQTTASGYKRQQMFKYDSKRLIPE